MYLAYEFTVVFNLKAPLDIGAGPFGVRRYYEVVGASGMGAYHGIEGFRAFSHAKGIFEMARWNGSNLLRAPFGWLADTILKFLLR